MTNPRGAALAGLALALLAALPALLATYPQMADYPAHLARWHVMLNLDSSPELQRHYTFTWQWAPNLGCDLLVIPLAKVLGLELAGRVIAALVPALLAASLMTAEWALRRRIGLGSLLALATVWSPSLLMGFLNWGLALALAFFSFALWIMLEGRRWRPWLFLALAPLVWLCHLSGWGVLGVLVLGHEWQRHGLARAVPRTWPLWPPAALSLFAGAGASGAMSWGDALLVDKLSNWVMGLRDSAAQLDLLTVATLAVLPLIAWRRGHIDGRIGRAALLLVAISTVMPRHLGGGDFADYRLIPVALACGVLAINWKAPRLWLALAALPFLLRLALTSGGWIAGSQQTAAMLGALDAIPRGGVVAGAHAEDPYAWKQTATSHVFAWATVRRDAVTNADFAVAGLHMLAHANRDPGFLDPSQRLTLKDGESARLAGFAPARQAEWLWFVGGQDPANLPIGAQVIARGPGWLIARLAKAPSSR